MDRPRISIFLPSLDGGGAERVFVQLANAFTRLGCAVDLILVAARGPYLREVNAGVRIIDLHCPRVIYSLPALMRYLRAERTEALLSALDTSNAVAVLAKKLSGVRTRSVISQRAVSAPFRADWRTAFASINQLLTATLMRLTYPWSDHVVAVATDVANELKRIPFLPHRRISIIFNPLDLSDINKSTSREDGACPDQIPQSPFVLGVGRLEKQKDFATLVRAFAGIAPRTRASLVILGEGSERAMLLRCAAELGLRDRLKLPGFVENPFPWFARASVFVLSSVFEGCPNALMQALACGTPVISTDCPGGAREILDGGKWGRLISVGDSAAMGEAILAALDATAHPDVRQRANDFALDRIAREYLRVLLPDRRLSIAEQ